MTFWKAGKGEGKALDGDPTMMPPTSVRRYVASPGDYESVSSIDKPLPFWQSSGVSRSPSDEADLDLEPPRLSKTTKAVEVPSAETPTKGNHASLVVTPSSPSPPPPPPPPPPTTQDPSSSPTSTLSSSQVQPPSPLRYKRTDPKQRRSLARKILEQRKKVQASKNGHDELEHPSDPAEHEGNTPISTHTNSLLAGPDSTKHDDEEEANVPEPDGEEQQEEVVTETQESNEEEGTGTTTVSWASTLTTDPSRLVVNQPEKSRQVPYLRLDVMPSVKEAEEPHSKLDRHFSQAKSLHAMPPEQHSSSPLSAVPVETQQLSDNPPPPRPKSTSPIHPYGNSREVEHVQTLTATDPAAYARDNALQLQSIRRNLDKTLSEIPEEFRRYFPTPHRSATKSDPGGNIRPSAFAAAAAHLSQLHRRSVSPRALSPDDQLSYGGSNDVLITLHPGGETYEHTSHILAYASPVLRQHLQPVVGGWYRLELHETSSVEWQLILPFLEPHSVQSAVVRPGNISHLLPWFVQLGLDVLLVECDNLLTTLEFPKAYSPEGAATSVSATADKILSEHPAVPQVSDMVDLLLLAEISSLARLPGTREASLDTLELYLSLHPGLATNSESLPILMRVLRDHPSIRQRLWRKSLVRFLPDDLPIFSEMEHQNGGAHLANVEAMVFNPLFPFLIREGLAKAAQEDDHNRRSLELEERWKRFRERKQISSQASSEFSDPVVNENSILLEGQSVSSSVGQGDLESINTGKLQKRNNFLEVCLENQPTKFAAWWLELSGEAQPSSSGGESRSTLQESLASIRNRAETQKLQYEMKEICKSPRSRTNWLELILQRLGRPPIFAPAAEGELPQSGVLLPRRTAIDHRKFLC